MTRLAEAVREYLAIGRTTGKQWSAEAVWMRSDELRAALAEHDAAKPVGEEDVLPLVRELRDAARECCLPVCDRAADALMRRAALAEHDAAKRDRRAVVLHETEIVATKEEVARGKAAEAEWKRLRAERDAAAKPVGNSNEFRPIIYHLDDGKVARGVYICPFGDDAARIVVDLTFGYGPSVVGKYGWWNRGYVECYGGLVTEAASEGKEPGEWEFGVLNAAQDGLRKLREWVVNEYPDYRMGGTVLEVVKAIDRIAAGGEP